MILESCRSPRCTCSCTVLVLQNPRTGTLYCHRALLKIHRAPLLEFQYSTVAVSVHALAPLVSSARSQYRYRYYVPYRYSSPPYPPTGTALHPVLVQLWFTGDLQIQSRASLFSARSESNPVLILPLRNRIKTYHRSTSSIAAIGRFSSIDLVLDCMGIIFPIPPHI